MENHSYIKIHLQVSEYKLHHEKRLNYNRLNGTFHYITITTRLPTAVYPKIGGFIELRRRRPFSLSNDSRPMFLDEHRHSSSETPHGASLSFFAHWNSSISTRATIQKQKQQQQRHNNDRTRRFHNRAIATRTLNKLIGNSIDDGSAAACPNTATCRFLAPGKRSALPRRDHTASCSQTERLVLPPRQGGEKNLGFACRFQTNSTTYLTISTSSLLFPRGMDS